MNFLKDLFGISAAERREQDRINQARQTASFEDEEERRASEARMRKLASQKGVASTFFTPAGYGAAPVSVRMLTGA